MHGGCAEAVIRKLLLEFPESDALGDSEQKKAMLAVFCRANHAALIVFKNR
jgi:hypothetical protein